MPTNKDSSENAAIISRLDTLIAAVNDLTAAVLASNAAQKSPAGPPPTVASPAAAPNAPNAPPTPPEPPATPTSTAISADDLEVVIDEHVVSGIPGAGRDLRATISRMFQAALVEETEIAWRELTALTHPKEMEAPRALDSLKAFSWKQLRKNAQCYLKGDAIESFVVSRTDPGDLTGKEERVKVFLQATGRSPAPVTLRRDESSGGAWRLGQISL